MKSPIQEAGILGAASFFPIGIALLEELTENASQYTSAQRTEACRMGISFCYLPMLIAEREAMAATGGFDLSRAREARREERMSGEGNEERVTKLIETLLRFDRAGVFSGPIYDKGESLYSNSHFIVSMAEVAFRDTPELVAGTTEDIATRQALIRRALVLLNRDSRTPYSHEHGLMMLILASIADRIYGCAPELAELFTGKDVLIAMGPVYLNPGEMREKADRYAEAIIKRIPDLAFAGAAL